MANINSSTKASEVIALAKKGASRKKITEQIGVSQSYVSKVLTNYKPTNFIIKPNSLKECLEIIEMQNRELKYINKKLEIKQKAYENISVRYDKKCEELSSLRSGEVFFRRKKMAIR